MQEIDAELTSMAANRSKYLRVKSLIKAMSGRGSDPAAYFATGDMIIAWLACMPANADRVPLRGVTEAGPPRMSGLAGLVSVRGLPAG